MLSTIFGFFFKNFEDFGSDLPVSHIKRNIILLRYPLWLYAFHIIGRPRIHDSNWQLVIWFLIDIIWAILYVQYDMIHMNHGWENSMVRFWGGIRSECEIRSRVRPHWRVSFCHKKSSSRTAKYMVKCHTLTWSSPWPNVLLRSGTPYTAWAAKFHFNTPIIERLLSD